MERLTEARGDRTWKLFRLSWYMNVILVGIVLLMALNYFSLAGAGKPAYAERHITMMGAMLVIACVFLIGAGISRYQARLEGQHLELKLAINKLTAEVEALRGSKD